MKVQYVTGPYKSVKNQSILYELDNRKYWLNCFSCGFVGFLAFHIIDMIFANGTPSISISPQIECPECGVKYSIVNSTVVLHETRNRN